MSRPLREQIATAFTARGWTLAELIEHSGLTCSEESMGRKLRGSQSLRAPEIEALAGALGVVVAFDGSEEHARATANDSAS